MAHAEAVQSHSRSLYLLVINVSESEMEKEKEERERGPETAVLKIDGHCDEVAGKTGGGGEKEEGKKNCPLLAIDDDDGRESGAQVSSSVCPNNVCDKASDNCLSDHNELTQAKKTDILTCAN